MVTLSSFPFPPTKPNMLINPKVFSITLENVSNRQLKTNLLNTLASPGLQAIEPIATAEVVNGQMSWAKLYKTVLLLSLEKDNLALLQQGEVLEQEIYNDLDTVLLIHQPHTPAQKPTPNKAKRNSSIFFRFFPFFSLFFAFFHFSLLFSLTFHFASIFSLNFRLFYLHFRFRFLVFRIEVNHVKSGFFFASKRNEIFASISNFASEAKMRAHPSTEGDATSSCFCCCLIWFKPRG